MSSGSRAVDSTARGRVHNSSASGHLAARAPTWPPENMTWSGCHALESPGSQLPGSVLQVPRMFSANEWLPYRVVRTLYE
jgi:hypothetical protein